MAWSDEEDGAGLLSITPVPQQKTKFAPTPRRRNTVSSPTLKKTESESSMLKSQIKKNNTPENSPSEKHTIQSNANESPTILASSWKRTPEAEEFHQRLKTAGELTALQEVLQKPLAPALAPAPARTASEASTKANTPPVPARRDHNFSSPVSPPVVTRRARASTISGSTPPPSNYPYPFPPPPPPQMKSQKGAHKKLNLARFKLLPRSGSVVESDEDGPIDAADLELLLRTEATIQKRIEELKEKEKELLQSCSILSGKTTVGPSVVSRKKKDTRKVNTREISICERLGAGFSGAVVYSCIVDGWVCAMKQLASENKIEMENFEKEMSLLYRLPHHPNIIRYLFHSTVNGKLCLFMTRHASTLQKVIHTKFQEKESFSETAIRSIAFKIVSGIKFLHGNQIIHRDIKTENIYVTPSSDGELKEVVIADFDTATRTGTANVPQSTIGTLGYMAPEVFNNKQLGTGYTFTADIFSFGMVLYSLITLREPFYHITNPFQIYEELLNNAQPILEEEQINRYSPELIELHRACININPQLRPNSSDILEILQNTSSSTERILSNSR